MSPSEAGKTILTTIGTMYDKETSKVRYITSLTCLGIILIGCGLDPARGRGKARMINFCNEVNGFLKHHHPDKGGDDLNRLFRQALESAVKAENKRRVDFVKESDRKLLYVESDEGDYRRSFFVKAVICESDKNQILMAIWSSDEASGRAFYWNESLSAKGNERGVLIDGKYWRELNECEQKTNFIIVEK